MDKVSVQLGQRVYADANVIIAYIYAVEGFAVYLDRIRALMAALSAGDITVVTSELTNDDVFRNLGLPQIKMLSDISLA